MFSDESVRKLDELLRSAGSRDSGFSGSLSSSSDSSSIGFARAELSRRAGGLISDLTKSGAITKDARDNCVSALGVL